MIIVLNSKLNKFCKTVTDDLWGFSGQTYCRSVLMGEKTGVPGENHQPATIH